MQVLHPRCCGLDVHKDSLVACIRIQQGACVKYRVESFGATYVERVRLCDWLAEHAVTHVLMEATGVYWRPIWLELEGSFEVVVANAQHVKNVPGRKTDVNDATWLADLLAHGLVRGSFIPPQNIAELRDLCRLRVQMVREQTQYTQRIHKALQCHGYKLESVLSDTMGKSGRAILCALRDGQTDPVALANLAVGNARKKHALLVEALRGHPTEHFRFLLRTHLEQIQRLDTAIATVEAKLGEQMRPFDQAIKLLVSMPGVSETVARTIVAETGADMSRFPSAAHLRSWAGLCPKMNESAGKRKNTRLKKGAPWLKPTMIQAAWAAIRTKDSYVESLFHRIKPRRGKKKAAVAVAASLLTAAYHMLKDGVEYKELGPQQLEPKAKDRTVKRLLRRLEALTGTQVRLAA